MSRSVSPGGQPSWLLKSVILLAPVPVALAFSTVTPILPKMSAALAHSAAEAYLVKMVLGVVGLAMVVGAPLAGLLADKVERRLLLVGSALVFSIAGAAPFFLDSLPLILVSRLVMGLAGITAYIIGATLVADTFDDTQRARWMGLFTAVAIIGGLVALFVAGALGDIGWRWPFLTYLVGLPLSVLGWVALPGGAPAAKPSPAKTSPAKTGARKAEPRAPFPVGLALAALLIGLITYAPSIYIPFHLATLGVVNPSAVGQALMISMVVSTVSSLLFGRARQVLSSRLAFCCSFAGVGAGVALIALAPTYPVAMLGLVLMGLGVGWLSPNLMASAAGAVEESRRGRTLGVVRSAHSLASALGITLLEPIAARIGAEGVLLLAAGLAGLMLLGTAAKGLGRRAPGLAAAARVPLE